MGIHGNSTCVMNYDNATGYLIGAENRGLNAMFVMMNEARLGVGVQGLALSEVAYQNAVDLREGAAAGPRADRAEISRQAGRSDHRASGRAAHAAVDPRRQRGRARAHDLDRALSATSRIARRMRRRRQHADDMMGLLTPVVKGVLTDFGFANAVNAQQMFGGHGYISETGVEQFVRDARIPMIYEGANGIQALDLVGRKLPKDGGRAVMAFFGEVQGFVNAHKGNDAMKPYRRAAQRVARPPAAGHDVVHEQRDEEPRQCRRGRDRLHAHVRAGGARADVGADCACGEREACGGGAMRRRLDAQALKNKLIVARFLRRRCCRKRRRN